MSDLQHRIEKLHTTLDAALAKKATGKRVPGDGDGDGIPNESRRKKPGLGGPTPAKANLDGWKPSAKLTAATPPP